MVRAERWATVVYLAICLVLLVVWLSLPHDGPATDRSTMSEAEFRAGWRAMAGPDEGRTPVRVAGDDIYLLARQWTFAPDLVVAPNHRYRVHFLAEDVVHSAAIGGVELLLWPGKVETISLTTPGYGHLPLQCGEYCGLGHSRMSGSIEVAK
ncbi:MAG TPA: hypothetical protein HPQ04_12400 [Rhodospirillaceae bacterium]|nr:hypothetical protein [Rhodospirillaceae bacterium]